MNLSASAKKIPILSAAAVGVIVTLLAATGDGLEMPLTKLFAADAGVFMSLAFLFLGGMTGMLATLLFGGRSKAVFTRNVICEKKISGNCLLQSGLPSSQTFSS